MSLDFSIKKLVTIVAFILNNNTYTKNTMKQGETLDIDRKKNIEYHTLNRHLINDDGIFVIWFRYVRNDFKKFYSKIGKTNIRFPEAISP